jgi:hypothetical protein
MKNKINCKILDSTGMRPDGFAGIESIIDMLNPNCVMAEIGCYYGESTLMWASSEKIVKIFAIDPWKDFYDVNDGASEKGNMAEVEKTFDENIKEINKIIKCKQKSLEAAEYIEDDSLNFVYLDGSHKYEDVVNDIKTWIPKIKKGGILGGHDIMWRDVALAVQRTIGQPDFTFPDTSWIKTLT